MEVENQEGQGPLWAVAPLMMMMMIPIVIEHRLPTMGLPVMQVATIVEKRRQAERQAHRFPYSPSSLRPWDETMSLNCGHQRTYCSSPIVYMSMDSQGGMTLTGETQ
jgi:hypothetical protein